ncbi:MAG TPA: cytochrome c oxidase subunit 3 [Terriglobales bacterium]|nr:cytochrome c oxidase subunit 3 [Terriglobales bacterium]
MATLNPTFAPKVPKLRPADGGGGPVNRNRGGGGGGGGGRGDNQPDFGEQLRKGRFAMAIGLTAVFMLFISFSSAFIVRQSLGRWDVRTQSYISDWTHVSLPLALFGFNTLLLILSSVTLELARRRTFREAALAPATAIPGVAVHKEHGFPWLEITLLLGIGFLVGQVSAWRNLAEHGFYLSGSPGSSFAYIITGMHALHLAGGILALLYAATVIRWRSQALERRRVAVDVTAWYWHFMTVLWVFIFGLLTLAT